MNYIYDKLDYLVVFSRMGCSIDNNIVFVITISEEMNKFYNFGDEPQIINAEKCEIIRGKECLEIVY